MRSYLRIQDLSGTGSAVLRLHMNTQRETGAVLWRINGFRAKLLVWTADEWERLETRPADAQFHPSGVWCALRLE